MVQPADRIAHGGDNIGMRMTQDGAHLAGGEIQHLPAIRVVQEAAGGAHRHERHEIAAIPQHVPASAGPERGILLVHVVHRYGLFGR